MFDDAIGIAVFTMFRFYRYIFVSIVTFNWCKFAYQKRGATSAFLSLRHFAV